MAEELTTAMHGEFIGEEVSDFDLRIAAVYGALNRGVSKQEALTQYGLTVEQYDSNIQRVLADGGW